MPSASSRTRSVLHLLALAFAIGAIGGAASCSSFSGSDDAATTDGGDAEPRIDAS